MAKPEDTTLGDILDHFTILKKSEELHNLELPDTVETNLILVTLPQFVKECMISNVSKSNFMVFMAKVYDIDIKKKEFEQTLQSVINNRRKLLSNNIIKEIYLQIGRRNNFIT